jgi:hypothetical protein
VNTSAMKQQAALLRFGKTKGRVAMAWGFGVDQDRHFLNLNTDKRRSVPEGRLNFKLVKIRSATSG